MEHIGCTADTASGSCSGSNSLLPTAERLQRYGLVEDRVHCGAAGVVEHEVDAHAEELFRVDNEYAAAALEAAVSETLLHDVPLTAGVLPVRSYREHVATSITVGRQLRLAKFMGDGLRRLGVTPQQLTATEGDVYGRTVLWSQAAHSAGFDGIVWMSARDNTSRVYMFFGDRVSASSVQEVPGSGTTFAPGESGFRWLSAYCARVGVELLID